MPDLKDDLAALRIEREPDRSGGARWIIGISLVVLLAAGGFAAWRWATSARAIEVETATVSERAAGVQAAVLNASGYVAARRRATVSSKITGKVVEVNVEEGMAVREGQVLARLDDATFKAALGLAEAQAEAARSAVRENEVRLAEAKVTLGRVTQLVKEQLATQAEIDAARAEVDSLDARIAATREQVRVAERQIELERTNLDNTIIRAPFSGVAISKDAQPGEMVSPVSAGGGFTRTGICTIVDMRSLEIEVDVNESYINRVKSSQQVTAILNAYPDWEIPAHVITTIPTADRQKATVLVRIAFEQLDPRILPDMGVKVTFLREAEKPAADPVGSAARSGSW
jgi:RND family efflux transporter MFP subunit